MFPTESPELVRKAVESVIGRIATEESKEGGKASIVGHSDDIDSLIPLRQAIHNRRIIDAVRSRLQKNWDGSTTFLRFDKQAALAGRTRLIDDVVEKPPLGSIMVEVSFGGSESEYLEFLKWFAPPTQDGHVVKS